MKHLVLAFAMSGLAMTATAIQADPLSPQDYAEIQQLYAKYNHSIDGGDGAAYADTFTPDGVFNNMTGREALVKFVNETWRGRMNGAQRRHWNSNLLVTGDSKTAKGSVYLMLLDLSTKPASVMMTGTYTDELVKTPQGWRFTKRAVNRDAAPAPAAGAPTPPSSTTVK